VPQPPQVPDPHHAPRRAEAGPRDRVRQRPAAGPRRRGRRTAPIDLRGLRRGVVRVRVVVRYADGSRRVLRRTYRTCTPGPKR
jgi:hypothetical protein